MEQWKIIDEFTDYKVSNLGRIKRVKSSKSNNSKVGRILKIHRLCDNGYCYV